MTIYTDTWPAEIKPGTRIRATSTWPVEPGSGPVVMEFTISEVDIDGELLLSTRNRDRNSSTVYPDQNWDIEILHAPLPTEEGYYLDKFGDLWIIDRLEYGDTHLRYVLQPGGVIRDPDSHPNDDPEIHAPFTRLVPEGAQA